LHVHILAIASILRGDAFGAKPGMMFSVVNAACLIEILASF
jgi:hypothetical protein